MFWFSAPLKGHKVTPVKDIQGCPLVQWQDQYGILLLYSQHVQIKRFRVLDPRERTATLKKRRMTHSGQTHNTQERFQFLSVVELLIWQLWLSVLECRSVWQVSIVYVPFVSLKDSRREWSLMWSKKKKSSVWTDPFSTTQAGSLTRPEKLKTVSFPLDKFRHNRRTVTAVKECGIKKSTGHWAFHHKQRVRIEVSLCWPIKVYKNCELSSVRVRLDCMPSRQKLELVSTAVAPLFCEARRINACYSCASQSSTEFPVLWPDIMCCPESSFQLMMFESHSHDQNDPSNTVITATQWIPRNPRHFCD